MLGNFEDPYNYIHEKVTWIQTLIVLLLVNLIIIPLAMFEEILNSSLILLETIVGLILIVLTQTAATFFISFGFLHLLFKLFKGKANFKETAKFGTTISIFSQIIIFLALIPIVTILASIITLNNPILSLIYLLGIVILSIIASLWFLHIFINVFSKLHQISKLRAGFVIISLIILVIILYIILIIIFIFFFPFLIKDYMI